MLRTTYGSAKSTLKSDTYKINKFKGQSFKQRTSLKTEENTGLNKNT